MRSGRTAVAVEWAVGYRRRRSGGSGLQPSLLFLQDIFAPDRSGRHLRGGGARFTLDESREAVNDAPEQPGDPSPEERQASARRQGLVYQGATEAVFAIFIAAGIGFWVDRSYETSPWGLVIGTVIGFGSFVLRLFRLGTEIHPTDSD